MKRWYWPLLWLYAKITRKPSWWLWSHAYTKVDPEELRRRLRQAAHDMVWEPPLPGLRDELGGRME